jgi:hypothetical protein
VHETAATPQDEARRLARRLVALEEGPMRTRAAAAALAQLPPALAAGVLAELVRGGAAAHRAAMGAMGRALAEPGLLSYDFTAEVYAEASRRGFLEVQVLLVQPPARRGREDAAERPDPLLQALSLGHRKTLARGHRDPDLLARLAADGEPSVVRELLQNPRLTEPLVVRIAARRPCRPETLRCVWEERRWRVRPGVLAALAKNPFLEPALALQLLPALGLRDLQEVAEDREMSAAVRALARRLAVLREAGG